MKRNIFAFVMLVYTTLALPLGAACPDQTFLDECYHSTESGPLDVDPDVDTTNLEVILVLTTPLGGHRVSTGCIV